MKLQISSNENASKPLIAEILSFYRPDEYEFVHLDIGDITIGRVALELKLSAEDYLASLNTEGTTSRLIRQAQNLSQFPISEIVVAATFTEVIFASRSHINSE